MKTLIPLVILIVTAGCATRGGIRALPDQVGEERLFAGTVRAAALAARNAVAATTLELVEAEQRGADVWYLIAWGKGHGYVRVLCQQVRDDVVAIRIVSRRDLLDGGDDWGATLFAQVALELTEATQEPYGQSGLTAPSSTTR